ncbi:uncharacterized protein LOC111293263 [Durio zibethinus]|uniref:Uncharacterized protein LOC111293263 n=1 Tax=Durio zibethinus TaxID=66656 RepID=A0A6P5YNU7_DURZI|nr:uncharacterized protein LOC111293263 [Durio zibethinus]
MPWMSDLVTIHEICHIEQEIHASVKVTSSNSSWLFSAIYASPRLKEREILWENLKIVASKYDLPWLVVGDLNEVLTSEDKRGGAPVSSAKLRKVHSCLNHCNLIDLGFKGAKFTWSNLRYAQQLIQERIDYVPNNPPWKFLHPIAMISHLPRVRSDYRPVLILLKVNPFSFRDNPFRFQRMRLDHLHFLRVLELGWSQRNLPLSQTIETFTDQFKLWKRETFGNVFHKK